MNEIPEKESLYNDKRVKNEILRSTHLKVMGETEQCRETEVERTESL